MSNNLIFLLLVLVIVVYCLYHAVRMWYGDPVKRPFSRSNLNLNLTSPYPYNRTLNFIMHVYLLLVYYILNLALPSHRPITIIEMEVLK